MEAKTAPHSGAGAGPGSSGSAWNRDRRGGFEWVAPSPSPVVVAELEKIYPDIVQVPLHPLEIEEDRWGSQAILARCLSRWIPPEVIVREFHRAGLPGNIDALALAEKHYIFQFSDSRAKTLALERPWVVNGQLLITADWIPEFIPVDSGICSALLWIRLPLLPIEFWNDDILSSILAVAGEYLYSDVSTKERKRGSFARACVRVDLSKPLRPGARIRGSRAPFWQQFSYENLEGICVSCGSVHLAGSCMAGPDSSSPAFGPGFGPWMAAVRRRKSPQTPSGNQKMAAGSSPARDEGWEVPRKLARRQTIGGIILPSHPGELKSQPAFTGGVNQVSGGSDKGAGEACEAVNGGKPVPAGTVAMVQPETATVTEGVIGPNPFACLDSFSESARTSSREACFTGPLKRIRPVEATSQRVVSRSTKSKGKGPLGGKDCSQRSFSFHASVEPSRGPKDPLGPGKKKSHRKDGSDLRAESRAPVAARMEGPTHDSAVSLLQKAILQDQVAEAMDLPDLGESSLSHLKDCSALGHVEASFPVVDQDVDQLMGDRVEAPLTNVSE